VRRRRPTRGAGAGGAAEPLSQELDAYDGRWVAVRDGLVVAHAADEESLRADGAVRHGDQLFPVGDPPSGFYLINVYPDPRQPRLRPRGGAGAAADAQPAARRSRVRRIARAMPRYLHTMYRITDPERSRAFYEVLGLEFRREMEIVRDGELEATNYFFAVPGQAEELELTFNHDGRTYELGTGYGHIALAVDDLETTLAGLAGQGIEPEKPPYRVREGGSLLCFVRDPDGYRIELIEKSA
jgi:lactoylglutathione lyase